MKNKRKEFFEIISVALLYSVFTVIIWKLINPYLTNDLFSTITGKLGIFAPIGMIILQVLQVIIAPIPVQPVSIACGYIFGAFWGFLISYLGLVLGSIIVFYIGKILGRPLVKKIVSKKIMKQYDGYIQNVSLFVLTLIMWLPLFPDDEILYILGMSNTKFRKLLIPLLIGKTGGPMGALLGAGIKKYSQYTIHVIIITLMMTVLGFYYRHELEKLFNKLLNKMT